MNYTSCLRYIKNYWNQLICYRPTDKQLHFGLPNRFVAPNNNIIFKNDQFYWDSYFIILGLVSAGKISLAKGMVENLCYLFNRFGIIPMRNRYYNLGTSQIPFLTSMILEVAKAKDDPAWLQKTMRVAELELHNYWMNKKLTEKHLVFKNLSRYCDHYITHLGAEHESGWDMTSRFGNRCLNILPVDLNSCLYKYETDLAAFFHSVRNYSKANYYKKCADRRKKKMKFLMWNEKKKFFFDFDFIRNMQNSFYSVAGFYPLWANLASPRQAELIRKYVLPRFESEGGIVNTQKFGISKEIKQHDYPNGWPGQQWIVIKGLLNYGYRMDAERIAKKWLGLNAKIFLKTGKFWEKYNVVTGGIGICNPNRYETQSGFAWTNAVFVRLVEELKLK